MNQDDGDGDEDDASTDGGVTSHTVRLELIDEPGQLLQALEPIAAYGGNLLSIIHERGDVTPRGRVPVEIDLECPPDRFDDIVTALRTSDVNVVQAGPERYEERVSVILVGHLIDTDFSGTLSTIESCQPASVVDVSLSAPQGTDDVSSARIRLAVEAGHTATALATVRDVAKDKDLRVIEPLVGSGGEGS